MHETSFPMAIGCFADEDPCRGPTVSRYAKPRSATILESRGGPKTAISVFEEGLTVPYATYSYDPTVSASKHIGKAGPRFFRLRLARAARPLSPGGGVPALDGLP